MKIAIMADSHDYYVALENAIKQANEAGCEVLLFAGDLNSPPGVAALETFNGNVEFVWGNNEGEKVVLTRKMDASDKITLHGDIFEKEIDGVRIFMNHYPRITEIAAHTNLFDLAIYAHNHTFEISDINGTILLNPGEIQGHATAEQTFVIFDTETKISEKIIIQM